MAKKKKTRKVRPTKVTTTEGNIEVSSPETAEIVNTAKSLYADGQQEQAMLTLQRAVQIETNNAPLVYLLARMFFETGRYGPCVEAMQHALTIDKKNLTYRRLMGDAYRDAGALDKAAAAYEDAYKLSPNTKSENYNLGYLLYHANQFTQAVGFLAKAHKFDPDDEQLGYLLGVSYFRCEQFVNSIKVLEKIYHKHPDFEPGSKMYALALAARGKNEESISVYKTLLQYNDSDAETYRTLADVEQIERLYGSAVEHYKTSLKLLPEQPDIYKLLSIIYISTLDNEKAVAYADIAAKMDPAHDQSALFVKSYTLSGSSEKLLAEHQAWDKVHGAEGRLNAFSHTGKPPTKAKLRIGYLSSDFHNHAVAHFIHDILKHHDRDKIDVSCFAQAMRRDFMTEKLTDLSDHWYEIQSLSDFEVAELVNRKGIDILIDLGTHVQLNRTRVLTWKPAPVQVNYLGYPGSSGLEAIDYWLTDAVIHPENTTEASTESKYRLPRCWTCFTPPVHAEIVERNLDSGPMTFGVVNHTGKFSTSSYKAWSTILDRCPEAKLIIKSPPLSEQQIREKLEANLEKFGMDMRRVEIMGSTKLQADHFLTYNDIDVCLDTFPYTGGTSTADAIWMGVPVITLSGERLAERMSASMLHSVGMDDWVTETVNDYIDIAVQCYSRVDEIRTSKNKIRSKLLASDMLDGPGMARALEKAYFEMYDEKMGIR